MDLHRVETIRQLNDELARCMAHRALLLHAISNIRSALERNENEDYLGARGIEHLRDLLNSADARLEGFVYLQGVVGRALHCLGEPLKEDGIHLLKTLLEDIHRTAGQPVNYIVILNAIMSPSLSKFIFGTSCAAVREHIKAAVYG